MLREVAQQGVLVSTYQDAILRLGTKDVLLDVRDLPLGSDVVRVDSLDRLATELPGRLRTGARVLKQYRGHGTRGGLLLHRLVVPAQRVGQEAFHQRWMSPTP